MKRSCLLIIILLITLTSLTAADSQRMIIDTGHTMPITSLIYDQERDFVFSCSEDGTLRIWNPAGNNLLYNEPVSRNPIRLAAIHPTRPEAAVVTSDNLNSFILLVYNWETGRSLYTVKLAELPLFIKYSPQGNFIVYGITDWKSLTFIDSETGSQLPYLTEGFGIVSSAFISSSEKTILTYSPSGYIQYWGVEEGTLKQKIPTIPNLENTKFTDNGRYMAASNSKEIMLIDLLNGNPISQHDLEEIDFIAFSPDCSQLYAYSRNNRGYFLSVFENTRNRLILSSRLSNLEIRKINGLTAENRNIYMAGQEGEIYRFNSYTEDLSVFSESNLYSISDAAMNNDGLLLVSRDNMLLLNSAVFADFSKISSSEPLMTDFPLPFEGVPGVDIIDENNFLIWSKDSASGTLAVFSPAEGVTQKFDFYPYAFTEINYQDNRVLTLDKNGGCSILNLETEVPEFEFTSFGLRTVCFTEEGNILGGRSQSSGVLTPLLHINTATGETVDIEDNNRLTSLLEFDPATGSIYSVGIEERKERLRTVLRKHTGKDFTRSRTILTALGENLDASILIEEGGTRIFTSLTTGGVNMLYWGGFTPFEETGKNPVKMLLMDDYLIGLNSEGTLTFWNKSSGEVLYTLYLFKDLSWVALFPDNTFLSSGDGTKYLGIFQGTNRRKLPFFRFRRRL